MENEKWKMENGEMGTLSLGELSSSLRSLRLCVHEKCGARRIEKDANHSREMYTCTSFFILNSQFSISHFHPTSFDVLLACGWFVWFDSIHSRRYSHIAVFVSDERV
ncbi:MAG: hypothetical protein KAV82_05845 [Phycisphaerae bacterium]|nr:hypothetical protein [Phycisphaerae bacterium]